MTVITPRRRAAVRSGLKVILDKLTAENSIGIVSVDIADEERS